MIDLIPIFVFIVIIVAIVGGTVSSIVSNVLEYKKSQRAVSGPADTAETAQLKERTEYLEERVRVLERIATDGKGDLAREIEDLCMVAPKLEKPS